jgi:uncharacterized iron-regulated membrane protein
MMSVTGVLLTYERQILAWVDDLYYSEAAQGRERLPLDALVEAASTESGFVPSNITLASSPEAPALVRAGRAQSRYLNPYTGVFYAARGDRLKQFFSVIVRWHRWFNTSDENRPLARAITGASNLIFLFLVLSGMYLWLPSVFRWSTMRLRLWFHPNANSGPARNFNWHHVFGFWAALPLLVIVCTATVFNYQWASNLVYQLAGEEPPQRREEPCGPREPNREAIAQDHPTSLPLETLSLESLFRAATEQVSEWQTLTVELPQSPSAGQTVFRFDLGNGGQPQKRHNLTLDSATGAVVNWQPFDSQPAGRQARSWIRFLHTGEALGIAGQTIAGLASLAAVLMVWTGLALSLHRLRRFLARNRRAGKAAALVTPVT